MTVVSMDDFRPPSRNDGVKWSTLRIEESSDGTTSLGQIDSQVLTPLDADPKNPRARDWTTDNATLPKGTGYYRVRFGDTNGDLSEYSDWVLDAPRPYIPSLRQVAVHIRARTVERATNAFAGTFTDNTRPTGEEAWESIDQAVDDVKSETGSLPNNLQPEALKAVRALIALRAAMIIERSYYPEQVGANKSPYPALERDWIRRLPGVVQAVKEALADMIVPGEPPEGEAGGGPVATDSDLVVAAGSRIHTKTGTWLGSGDAQGTFPDDEGGMIGYGTQF